MPHVLDMRIALWQTTPIHDIGDALARLDATAAVAAQDKADLLITPEMYLGGYNIGADEVAAHAARSSEVIAQLAEIAKRHTISLVAGLALPAPSRPFNGCIAIDATGAELCRYAKTHLFGTVDAAQFTAGQALSSTFSLCGLTCSLAICYDIEFPELARALTLAGTDIILVPTANMAPFDSVATRLVAARAEENAVYVAYANYVGAEGTFTYNGLSCLCGPDGRDLLRGGTDTPELLYADINRSALDRARAAQTHLADRRPDLYGGLS